jgi:hypothetical protein
MSHAETRPMLYGRLSDDSPSADTDHTAPAPMRRSPKRALCR